MKQIYKKLIETKIALTVILLMTLGLICSCSVDDDLQAISE